MYKLEFTLKQHTPIIHFQHDQEGATLRATEVKPKLDRFLYENRDRLDYPYFRENVSNPYSMKIVNTQKSTILEGIENFSAGESNSIPLVLSNMGKHNDEISKFSWIDSDLKLIIKTAHKKLLSDIQFIFPEFLFYTNFGSRSSKGFGSFYLSEECEYYVDLNEYDESFYFDVTFKSRNEVIENCKSLFKYINTLHKAIRSGIQEGFFDKRTQKFKTTFYLKSVLWLYSNTFAIQWDKKTIKTQLLGLKSNNEPLNNKFLIKELLGLSTLEKWNIIKEKDSEETLDRNIEIKREHDCTSEAEKIERIPSPFIYKPIKTTDGEIRVYLIPKGDFVLSDNQKFKISVTKPSPKSILLPLATSKFNIKGYFNFMFKPKSNGEYIFEIKDLVDEKLLHNNLKHDTLILLEDVFKQVRRNAKK